MKNNENSLYKKNISDRSFLKYYKGLLPRYISYLRNNFIVWVARKRGANIGTCVTMPFKLAKKANKNLVIGNHSSVQTHRLDLRASVVIGEKVIIGSDVEIITVSHDVDSIEWEHKYYGLVIEDYCWLATRSFILPSCRVIGRGAICAAGSVVVNNVPSMAIMAGNPAGILRYRKKMHENLCVESLLGNDYLSYIKSRQF